MISVSLLAALPLALCMSIDSGSCALSFGAGAALLVQVAAGFRQGELGAISAAASFQCFSLHRQPTAAKKWPEKDTG